MPAPNLGPDYALAARLSALEDAVRRLQQNPLGQAFSATQSDGSIGVQVFQEAISGSTGMAFRQGTTTSRDPNTAQHPLLMYVGEVFRPDGTPLDSTVLFFATNGNTRGQIGGGLGVAFYDNELNAIFATDNASGEGLADPWLPLPTPQATGVANWPKTNATSWGTVAESEFRAQHVKVWCVAQAFADSGTNGSVRLVVLDGTGATVATSPTHGVTGGAFTSIGDTLSLPAGFWGQVYTLAVQCEVTSGTGNVYCQTFNVYGRQS